MQIPDNLMQIYQEMNTTDMARHYQVSRATVSKWLRIQREADREKEAMAQ